MIVEALAAWRARVVALRRAVVASDDRQERSGLAWRSSSRWSARSCSSSDCSAGRDCISRCRKKSGVIHLRLIDPPLDAAPARKCRRSRYRQPNSRRRRGPEKSSR